jgi:hypothetical protein
MKDELVRRSPVQHLGLWVAFGALRPKPLVGVFVSLAVGLSGCNGCNGCEGQTVAPVSPPEQPRAEIAVPNVAPSAVQAAPEPSAVVSAAASVAPNPEHDPSGVRRCCKTISDNLGTAPDKHKATWKSALEACNQVAEKQTGRKGLDAVRDILTPVGWPAACQ